MKTRLLIFKLRKRGSAMTRTVSSDVEERLDIHRQRMTKALLYLLISTCEVHHPRTDLRDLPVPIQTAYE